MGDTLYGTRENRRYLKEHGIRFAGKALGRPRKVTAENREALARWQAQRREDYRQRISIEGKFGQGKRLSSQPHSGEACRHLGGLDPQHLSGDELDCPVEDLFCAE